MESACFPVPFDRRIFGVENNELIVTTPFEVISKENNNLFKANDLFGKTFYFKKNFKSIIELKNSLLCHKLRICAFIILKLVSKRNVSIPKSFFFNITNV